MWFYDGPEHYYTNPCRKYLIYNNTIKNGSYELEIDALKTAFAIGEILQRTVILPAFHFGGKDEVSLNTGVQISTMERAFPNYREHTFLSHPLVPSAVKNSRSKRFLIYTHTAIAQEGELNIGEDVAKIIPENEFGGASEREIRKWFAKETASILQFHSLYGSFLGFDNPKDHEIFRAKAENIQNGTYMQMI